MKRIMNIIILGGFIAIIYLVLVSDNPTGLKLFLTVSMLIVLAFNILYEFLKHFNEKCQIALVVDCDLEAVETWISKIQRYDLLKGMRPSLHLMQPLIALDKNQPQACIDFIQAHQKFFSGHPDYLLIQYHSLFKAHALLGNNEAAMENYQELQRFKSTKKKSVSQLFNWHEIDGIHYYLLKKYHKSLQAFKAVDTSRLNNRELIHYATERALLDVAMKHETDLRKYQKMIQEINPNSPYLTLLEQAYETR